ncbi:nitrogen regulatory protein P-II [Cupriavidus sp. SK-3]|uniref:P-II family nitrogen regulator n=1 Tax=Cupriavidus sp. SK-3 TaxID=1470558 RepID=UPI00044DB9D5|nr:P-II family nitrogen regulator [Cupriavidus sp. SK-3]KDP87222.1 nitrogen regulatory protein P-II [Cupriavidus sp. SK-3]
MSTKCIIAIVPSELLERLEKRLATVHAPGLTATKVKGYGEYRNFFSSDLTTVHTKIEIFAEETEVEAITNAIVEVGQSTVPGAGIVAVLPVDSFLHLRVAPGEPER